MKIQRASGGLLLLAAAAGLMGISTASTASAADAPPIDRGTRTVATPEQRAVLDTYLNSEQAGTDGADTRVLLSGGSRRATYYRGTPLMWTRENVDFSYNGSRVISSNGWQQNGYVFPNTAQNKGITMVSSSNAQHIWQGANTVGAGVITPWGAADVYKFDVASRVTVNGNGAWTGRKR